MYCLVYAECVHARGGAGRGERREIGNRDGVM